MYWGSDAGTAWGIVAGGMGCGATTAAGCWVIFEVRGFGPDVVDVKSMFGVGREEALIVLAGFKQ